jgi:hypothetical protein
MSGELEAAGALATAGAVAGAIEGREPTEPGEGACLNCGAKLEGRFCAQCGQAAHPHRKLAHVLEEFMHGLLHFDTKTWRTLPMVVFRPGTLTRNYVYGKRARYLSPLALFLFSIFLMFFVFSFFDPPGEASIRSTQDPAALSAQLEEAREELRQAQAELEQARTNPSSDQPEGLEAGLAEGAVRIAESQVERLERQLAAQQAAAAERAQQQQAAPTDAPTAPAAEEEADDDQQSWRDVMREAAERDDFVVIGGMPALNERVRRSFQNPDLALFRIQEAASKFSFLLAPLSLPFIALLFLWKRGVTLYDHMAYALYALSFASILFVTVTLTAQTPWTNWLAGWLVMVGLPVHIFFHLKGAYALGWFSALWRTIFMLIFAMCIALVFLTLIVVVGLVG